MPAPSRKPASVLVEKIRALLAARGLSLADLVRKSRLAFPNNRHRHIPHNLYDAIRKRRFSPSVCQIATLSLLSGYRFVDWLAMFGLSLDQVARFQASFPAPRTVELDGRIYHPRARIPWFRDLTTPSLPASLTPLSQWLASAEPRPAEFLFSGTSPAFRFVKIGSQDAYAFPELLPGSIVRVAPLAKAQSKSPAGKNPGKKLFLVEHGGGLVCSQMERPKPDRIVLCSGHLPYASAELVTGTQAEVLGVADVEIRRIARVEKPVVPPDLGVYWTPVGLWPRLPSGHVGKFIHRARKRSGLSFREASRRTRLIAELLGDSRYFCAPGSLSDYETWKSPPRHIQKLVSICAVYFASAAEFLAAANVELDRPGQLAMPSQFLVEPQEAGSNATSTSSKFIKEIENQFQQLPYFLYRAMPVFFGLPDLSVRDIFWTGPAPRFVHPFMDLAVFLVVDRRKKMPRSSLSSPKWAQPIYVFLRRDGTYLCGSCTSLNGILMIHPCTAGLPKVLRLQNRVDAEVVGQVVGIVRRIR